MMRVWALVVASGCVLGGVARADVYVGSYGGKLLRVAKAKDGYRFAECRDVREACVEIANRSFSSKTLEKELDRLRAVYLSESDRLASRHADGRLTDADQRKLAQRVADIFNLDFLLRQLRAIQEQGYARVGYKPGEDVRFGLNVDIARMAQALRGLLARIPSA